MFLKESIKFVNRKIRIISLLHPYIRAARNFFLNFWETRQKMTNYEDCEFNNFFYGNDANADAETDVETTAINQKKAIAKEMRKKKEDKLRNTRVCTYWLQGCCNKGENCTFLHYVDPKRMPLCKYVERGVLCPQMYTGCPYLHDPTVIHREECKYFSRGYCKLGRRCNKLHIQKKLCLNYQLGFCPKGPKCPDEHLKQLICFDDDNLLKLANLGGRKVNPKQRDYVCHKCGQRGHSDDGCTNKEIPKKELFEILKNDEAYQKKIKTVICHKCNQLGHYTVMCDAVQEDARKRKEKEIRKQRLVGREKYYGEKFMDLFLSTGQIFDAFEKYYEKHQDKIDQIELKRLRAAGKM